MQRRIPWIATFCLALPLAACLAYAGQETSHTAGIDDARLQAKNGDFAHAESDLRSYLTNHENSAEARYLLGFVLFRENKPQQSLDEYTHAAQLKTPDALSLRYVALDYVLLDAYPDAEKWMRRSLALEDREFEAWYDFGRILQMQSKSTEARSAFLHALMLNPQSVKAENNLGLVYESLNLPEDAGKTYRHAIAMQAGATIRSEQPYLNLGVLLTNSGEVNEAQAMLAEAVALAPKDAKIREEFGRLYLREERWAEAGAELKKAISLGPETASLHFLLGQAYRHMGEAGLAKSEFARAAELNGTHSSPTR